MGYLIITDVKTGKSEVLGDTEKMKKAEGIPNFLVLQSELDEIDKSGE